MSGGSSLPYGNIKNGFVLSVTPSGTNVGTTSISIGTGGAVLTFNVPGIQLGDFVDVIRQSNTINGNVAPGAPWVAIANSFVSTAGILSLSLSNTSTLAISTPIESYTVMVLRPDAPSVAQVPSGFY
jgi:hypothetical protein